MSDYNLDNVVFGPFARRVAMNHFSRSVSSLSDGIAMIASLGNDSGRARMRDSFVFTKKSIDAVRASLLSHGESDKSDEEIAKMILDKISEKKNNE